MVIVQMYISGIEVIRAYSSLWGIYLSRKYRSPDAIRSGEPVVGREHRREIKRSKKEAITAMEDDEVMKLDKNGVHRTSLVTGETSHAPHTRNPIISLTAWTLKQYLAKSASGTRTKYGINIINPISPFLESFHLIYLANTLCIMKASIFLYLYIYFFIHGIDS